MRIRKNIWRNTYGKKIPDCKGEKKTEVSGENV